MIRLAASLLAGTMLAGCTVNTGVKTTPSFSQARVLPSTTQATPDLGGSSIVLAPELSPSPGQRGAPAVLSANRIATIEPDSRSMQGATWVITDPSPSLIYRVCTSKGSATTILLASGGKFNAAIGGDVEAFVVNVSYSGPRPAVSILPRTGTARGNLQLVTTDGFYTFDLVHCSVALNLVDVERNGRGTRTIGGKVALGLATQGWPQPEGDYTALAILPGDGKHRPAWSPAEAWADSTKMVVRFNGPLPTLPTLFAGQQGEQMISYRTPMIGGTPFVITSRRVTEAELRLDSERVRLTTDPDGIKAGIAADPAQGADGWRQTTPLPPQANAAGTGSNVAVFVLPQGFGTSGTLPAGTFGTSGTLEGEAAASPSAPAPPARQPMANGVIGL
jgi:hypothetical protein